MGHCKSKWAKVRALEDGHAEDDWKCGSLAQEDSMLPSNHSCVNLLKNVAAFFHCPKSLPVKNFELIVLSKEISRQTTIILVLWVK